jgi:hypothetical protein
MSDLTSLVEGDGGRLEETPGDQWASRMWMKTSMDNRDIVAKQNDPIPVL